MILLIFLQNVHFVNLINNVRKIFLGAWFSSSILLLMVKTITNSRYMANNYSTTSREACLWQAFLLWRVIYGISAKALWCQCFSTSKVSYVDDRGNWSKVLPVVTMWQCFRVIMCKAYACMHIMIELARYACIYMNSSRQVSLTCLGKSAWLACKCNVSF